MSVVSTVPRGYLELAQDGSDPVIIGTGAIDYLCGGCGRVLFESVATHEVDNLVVQCGACSSLNMPEA
jgi:hypothetical protein